MGIFGSQGYGNDDMVIWKSETMDFDGLAKWNFLMSGCGHEKLGELGKLWTLPSQLVQSPIDDFTIGLKSHELDFPIGLKVVQEMVIYIVMGPLGQFLAITKCL